MPSPAPALVLAALLAAVPALARPGKPAEGTPQEAGSGEAALAKPQASTTEGSVTVEGQRVDYQAVAGTLVLHGTGLHAADPTVSMFYVAYTKKGADPAKRPITFLYNGGPGSASVWLHMGAFGPRRVVTGDGQDTPAAPYELVNNDYSLLDVSDVVFIDAPGTGFSRLLVPEGDQAKRAQAMKERQKAVYGVDGDAQAFAQFITQYLSQYGRWNSPKYLFGESYGTTRSAVLANILENQDAVDLNGVILLSQILNFDTSVDGAQRNPGVDLPYILALPTYAATAFYHHKLPQQPSALGPFLDEVEQYAQGDYAQALMAGDSLGAARSQAVARKLHQYTGLPVDYLLKADLRVTGPMFEHELLGSDDLTTGRLDTRFSGPSLDPMGKDAAYDPQSAAISAAYISVFNDYVRKQLKFGEGRTYRIFADIGHWDFAHRAPGSRGRASQMTPNVMPDLAMAMKTHPGLKVMLNGGYYDLATPFFAALYEMRHLPIPADLQKNISYAWYPSGHMVYVHPEALKQLHDNVARFIQGTSGK